MISHDSRQATRLFFKPLAVHVTKNEDNVTFADFKMRLRIYEEAKKNETAESMDNVMKTSVKQSKQSIKTHFDKRTGDVIITCDTFATKGCKAR